MVDTSPPNRHIPAEILEQILSNLPIKCLIRFSSVAISWKSTIAKLQRRSNNRMVVMNDNPSYFDVAEASYAPLPPSLSLPPPITAKANYPNFVFPFRVDFKVKAVSDKLWCVSAKKSLYLWNPSTGACKKLSHAPPLHFFRRHSMWPSGHWKVAYGLGYDAVEHDYKLLKICRSGKYYCDRQDNSYIYSLKNDSWTQIRSHFPGNFPDSDGLFVDTTLNWMVMNRINWNESVRILVSFDFSTEEFRVLEQPMYTPVPISGEDVVDVAVLGGKLCVFLNYFMRRSVIIKDTALVVWAMEEYGVAESWTKLYEIRYKRIPQIWSEFRSGTSFTLRPLYVYEDGRVVVWACGQNRRWYLIVCKGREVVAHSEIVPSRGNKGVVPNFPTTTCPTSRVREGFVYVESLVSPADFVIN